MSRAWASKPRMTDNRDVSSAPPAPPSHATAPPRFGREDVVRAGRTGSPWEYVPLALAALRVLPGDAEIRFLLATAYAKLTLRTPALEQIERLPDQVRHDPGVAALREAVIALPNDRVALNELDRTLCTNLAALAKRGDVSDSLLAGMDAWRGRASKREHFRARTGDVVWRSAGDAGAWERFDSQREQSGTIRLPHDESPTATVYPTWYAVDGFDPPWMLMRVWRSTGTRADGFAPYLLAAQCDPGQALDGLAQHDLSELLADLRVQVFIGETAAADIQRFLSTQAAAGVRVACAAIGLPTTRNRAEPSISEMTDRAARAAGEFEHSIRTQLAAAPPRRRAFWADRFRTAGTASAKPLHVLIPTSRFSTFLRHSAADLADALNNAGCDARVLMEPDNHSLLEPLAGLRACEEHRPDLIVIPNYARAGVASRFPADIPFVTWVQDSMPHLYEKGAGARLGELDFIAGNLREDMFQHFGYPRVRALHMPMAASARKFHPGSLSSAAAARHACEIAYVSHHSETSAMMHARKLSEAASLPRVPELLGALFDSIMALVDSPLSGGPLTGLLTEATREEVRRAGLPGDEPAIAGVLTAYVFPIADRALRHRTLGCVATIAARRNWRIHLYGKGWETHPTLAPHARGELFHGEDLRACYQAARAHLHVSLHTAVHQRVFECAMSGGLPICRLQADDLSQFEYLVAAAACRTREPDTFDPDRRTADGYRYGGYAIDDSEPARRYADFLRSLDLPVPAHVWLNQIHAERLRASPAERIDGEEQALWNLWPDPASLMFHDERSLERVLTRAIEDDGWRTKQATLLGDHARKHVSYDAFARKLLDFVTARLSSDSPVEPPRWYDNRASRTSTRPATPTP